MKPFSVTQQCWAFAAAVFVSGCVPVLFDDRCGPETRKTEVRGDFIDPAGVRIGYSVLTLLETRGGDVPRQLNAIFMGPSYGDPGPLRHHIVTVHLVGPADTVLRAFPVEYFNEHEIIKVPPETVHDAAEFDALRRWFRAGEATLLIDTDLPGMQRLRVPLPLQAATGWSRAHCS